MNWQRTRKLVAEINGEVQIFEFCFSNCHRFPELFETSIKYLSTSVDSAVADAERSVSQYTLMNVPQRQCFTVN